MPALSEIAVGLACELRLLQRNRLDINQPSPEEPIELTACDSVSPKIDDHRGFAAEMRREGAFSMASAYWHTRSRNRSMSRSCSRARRFCRTDIETRAEAACLRACVSLQDLRKILRKGGARQDHIAPGFLGLLLQLTLNMRKISDQADALAVLI